MGEFLVIKSREPLPWFLDTWALFWFTVYHVHDYQIAPNIVDTFDYFTCVWNHKLKVVDASGICIDDGCLYFYRLIEVCMQKIICFGKEPCDVHVFHDQLHFAHFVARYQLDLILFTLNCLFPHHSYYAAILRVSVKSIDFENNLNFDVIRL